MLLRDLDVAKRARISSRSERNMGDEERAESSEREPKSNLTSSQRAEYAAQIIHSANMEGVEVSQPVVLETYDYIAGRISASTLVDRVKALHGLE